MKKNALVSKLFIIGMCAAPLFGCANSVSTSSSDTNTQTTEPDPTPTEDESRAIKVLSPLDGASISIVDDAVTSLLAATDSADELKILKDNAGSNAGANAINFSWDSDGSAFYKIYISETQSLENAQVFKVSGIMNSLDVYNLIPGKTYYWKVEGTVNGDSSKVLSFTTVDSHIRPITASGTFNVRDFGGWKTNNDIPISFGKLYRGGMLNGVNNVSTIDEDGINTFVNQLGIKTEIDLRNTGVDDGNQQANAFNSDGLYIQAPVSQYTGILDRENWETLPANERSGYSATTKTSLKTIFDTLGNENNYPIYMHCNYGADRTGTVAFLINGLLGVDYSDLIKDFEITSFSKKAGVRYRSALNASGTNFNDSGVYQNDSNNFVAFGAMYKSIMNFYGTPGGTLESAIENYLTSYVGVNPTTILSIKKTMLSNYKTDDMVLEDEQELLLTDTTKSVDLSSVDYDSITDITCDGVSLGSNPNDLNIPNIQTLFGNKELIVTAVKNGKKFIVYIKVNIITKEISTWDELIDAVQFGEEIPAGQESTYVRHSKYGYFRLANNIVSPSASKYGTSWYKISNDCQSISGEKGFLGILDGNGYSITSESGYGGLFALTGNGSQIKNVTFVDNNYDSIAVSAVLAVSLVGTTFDNVRFVCKNASTAPFKDAVGWVASSACVNCVFNNVSFEGEGKTIASLFGGYKNWIGFKNTTFNNCTTTFSYIGSVGYLSGTSSLIGIESIKGISGCVSDTSKETNTIAVIDNEANLKIDSKYAHCSVLSVSIKGTTIPGEKCDLYKGNLYFSTLNILDDFDEGNKDVYVLLQVEGGITVNLRMPVYIEAPVEKVDIDSNDIDLSDKGTYSLSLGKYTYMNIKSIVLGDYSLGNKANALNITKEFLNDPDVLGPNTFIVSGQYELKNIILRVHATVINKMIATVSELYDAVGKGKVGPDGVSGKFGGYYKLANDLSGISFGDYVPGKAVYSYNGVDKGFQGVLDGDGHKLTGAITACYGLFCLLGNGSVIKNLEIVNTELTYTAGGTTFAYAMNGALVENVTITVQASNSAATTVCDNYGLMNAAGCQNSTFRNIVVNAIGQDVGSLFGGFNDFEPFYKDTNTFENFVVNANSLQEVGHKGAVGSSTFISYSVNDISGITFNKK